MKEINLEQYKRLFNTNLQNTSFDKVLNDDVLIKELEAFDKSTADQVNYVSKMDLQKWSFKVNGVDKGDEYETIKVNGIPVLKKYLYDIVPTLNVKSVLDGGAGGGMNTKILSTKLDKDTKFICVENYKKHCEHIKANLGDKYNVNKPHVRVNDFEVINASLHNIPLEDNSVELAFTHAVMSHIPFLPSVLAIKELARVSSKYVLHIEQKNSVQSIVVPGYTKHSTNKGCTMNYPKIYEELGFKQISYEETPLGVGKQIMCVYLGEKIK